MKRRKKPKHFIKKAYFPGGDKAMRAFVTANMVYPPDALKNRVEGTVSIRCVINYKGKVTSAKVIGGIGHGCDEEAVRLVKLFKFNVSKVHGLKVQFKKSLQIHFRLPKKPPTPAVSYKYTTPTEDKSTSYNYTIELSG